MALFVIGIECPLDVSVPRALRNARSVIGLLLAYGLRESLQSRHRQFTILIHQAASAQYINDLRTIISQSPTAEKLNQRSLLKPGQFLPDGCVVHRRFPLVPRPLIALVPYISMSIFEFFLIFNVALKIVDEPIKPVTSALV
jgi:hypothetical protein